jgi:putative transposase
MREHKISQRRVCDLVGVDHKTVRRERPPDHADIRNKMHEIVGIRRQFGFRRVGILLEREGFTMNEKKLYRLYKEEGLSVRRRSVAYTGNPQSRPVCRCDKPNVLMGLP